MPIRMGRTTMVGWLAVLFFILAWGSQSVLFERYQPKQVARRVQKHFSQIERIGQEQQLQIARLLIQASSISSFAATIDSLQQKDLLGDVLLYQGDELLYYSNHALCFDQTRYAPSGINRLPNGTYWIQSFSFGKLQLRYCIALKQSYSIKNKYLHDNYLEGLRLPEGYVLNQEEKQGLSISFLNGQSALTLVKTSNQSLPPKHQLIVGLLFTLALLCFIRFVSHFIRKQAWAIRVKVALLLLVFSLIYFLHLKARFPAVIWDLALAQPTVFAASSFFPSITALSLFSLLSFTFCFFIFRLLRNQPFRPRFSVLLLLCILFVYLGMSQLIKALVVNSSFTLQLNQVNQLGVAVILAYLCIGILFLSCFLLQLKICTNSNFNPVGVRKVLGIASLISLLLYFLLSGDENCALMSLFWISSWFLVLYSTSRVRRGSIFYLISFTALYALFTLVALLGYQEKQGEQLRELYAYNKYEGHDAEVELIFKNRSQAIQNDRRIPDLMAMGDFKFIEDYVEHEYLNDLSNKYQLWISVCSPHDEILIEPEGIYTPCYAFFHHMLQTAGNIIPQSNFYYIDTPSGQISYFGKFRFQTYQNREYTLFVQLEAKMKEEGLGFPELLTDASQLEPPKYSGLSFAKYHSNQLIAAGGEYPYSFEVESYMKQLPKGISHLKKDNYRHTVYVNNRHDVVIVSSPEQELWEAVFFFTYIFLFFLLIALLAVFFGSRKERRDLFNYDLNTRIQLAIIITLIVSLILVSFATVRYNLQQYKERHRSDLNEKMHAISMELNYQLAKVSNIRSLQVSAIWENLGNWSNIFQTDINIYTPQGQLVASSRPALFNLGLSARQMNSQALHHFKQRKSHDFMQPENVGGLQFLSAYQTITNEQGEVMCYINLPYFMRSDSLRQDVLNFIVAFINLSVFLLLLSILAALALSNRITKPLSHIKESLRDMSISKQNKPISYVGNDEIGDLVQEYNNKLVELEESAQLLAQSQRELAWKEMARQVAHEIKNPLTPMKLQIQHLQRAKAAGDMERYNMTFDKVTSTLIEQIDRLTSIANSFSQFAKMPEPKPDELNLVIILQQLVSLFETQEQLHISLQYDSDEEFKVYADGEQLSRAFLNIITNAQQAVSSDREALIDISMQIIGECISISIGDNGGGVPETISSRLFEPNFTTKSSGMGLGLAIVKRSVEAAKGRVWFESSKGSGTTFFIELPKKD